MRNIEAKYVYVENKSVLYVWDPIQVYMKTETYIFVSLPLYKYMKVSVCKTKMCVDRPCAVFLTPTPDDVLYIECLFLVIVSQWVAGRGVSD